MGKSIDYHDYLIKSLEDPTEAAGYLNAALDDGDIDGFLEALRNVVEAHGGMTKLAEKSSDVNLVYKADKAKFTNRAPHVSTRLVVGDILQIERMMPPLTHLL